MIYFRKTKRRFPLIPVLLIGVLLIAILFGIAFFKHKNITKKTEAALVATTENIEVEEITSQEEDKTEYQSEDHDENMNIALLDVDQGLCVVLEKNGEYLIYDGGGQGASSVIVAYLKKQNIESVKYIVCSHYDEDHIGGLVGVLYNFSVENVICPDYEAETDIYGSFQKAVAENGANVIHPKEGDTFSLEDVGFEILSPSDFETEDENNKSIVIRVEYNEFHAILTGDAEYEEENYILQSGREIQSDLYVVGHHGSSSSTSEDFLDAVNPKYAFLSVGKDNSYGHPAEVTMNKLKSAGLSLYRTDIQDDICLTTDGKTCELTSDACQDWSSGTQPVTWEENTETSDEAVEKQNGNNYYILNNNTKKFHFPDCPSADTIKDKNKEEVEASRDELIERGYSPCGNCHP